MVFLSRLTSNNQYYDRKKNDKLLAIWYGLGFYLFTTSSSADNNPNLDKNIDTQDDIEGMDIYLLSKMIKTYLDLSHLRSPQYQIQFR